MGVNSIDNVRAMDAYEFARLAGEATGEVALSALLRFGEGLPEQSGKLQWSVRGEQNGFGKSFLHLAVKAAPTVQCQRCMAGFAWPVDSSVTLELVRSEADLDVGETDDDEDPDAPDRVVGSRRFDLLAHVEDELILAVPYITRHPECPELPDALKQQDSSPEERRPSPFAALEKLKTR